MTDKLSEDIKNFLDKDSTKDFLKAARHFVDLLEIEQIDQEEFYLQAHKALVDLYAAGHKLVWIDLKYSDSDKDYDRDDFDRGKNAGKIGDLGEETFYWEVIDPTYTEQDGQPGQGWKITDKEPSQGWLVDDFSDIYNDLKTDLDKIDNNWTDEFVEDALWQMKWGFDHHWGHHCINAMRALHYLWYDGKTKKEKSTVPNKT